MPHQGQSTHESVPPLKGTPPYYCFEGNATDGQEQNVSSIGTPRTGTKTSSSRMRQFSPSRSSITPSTTRFMLKSPLRCVLRVQEAITLPTSWFGGGVTPLHFCEKGVKTGARVYQEDVRQGGVKPRNRTVFNGQKWVFFQQNSVQAHEAKTTQEWLRGTFQPLSAPRTGPL